MTRNPNWTRDELILALDLFVQCGRKQLPASHPDVVELSKLLNTLPIHPFAERNPDFRNPGGVSMKLGNFIRLDPQYAGVGLSRGGKLDREVWEEFIQEPYYLSQVAETLRKNIRKIADYQESYTALYSEDDREEFIEGKLLTRLHQYKERNPRAVARKKKAVLDEQGRLQCEVCDFDFMEVYGDLGKNFAECHHLFPVAQLQGQQSTKIQDLAIVCANCHRMIHRSRPMLSIEELRAIVHGKRV